MIILEQEYILRRITQKVLSEPSDILKSILSGKISPLNILEDEITKDAFIKEIENEWENISDVKINPFGKLEDIPSHEKSSALNKILDKIELLLQEEIQAILIQHQTSCLKTYYWQLEFVKKGISKLTLNDDIPSSVSISKLRDRISELHEAVTDLEKTNLTLRFFDFRKTVEVDLIGAEMTSELSTPPDSDTSKYEALEWNWTNQVDLDNGANEPILINPASKDIDSLKDTTLSQNHSDTLTFKRLKLTGGLVYDSNGKQVDYLNEAITRALNLNHNDEIRISSIRRDGKNTYEIIRRAEGSNPDRIELQYCIAHIDSANNTVIINEHISGGERQSCHLEDGTKYQFHFSLLDSKLRIDDGSIVDLAYWRGRPDTAKIIWNHLQQRNNLKT